MGNNQSGEIKYMYTNVGGNSVPIPYVRLPNGQWIPVQQQNWYIQQWNAQRALTSGSYMNQNLLNPNAMYLANQPYYSGSYYR